VFEAVATDSPISVDGGAAYVFCLSCSEASMDLCAVCVPRKQAGDLFQPIARRPSTNLVETRPLMLNPRRMHSPLISKFCERGR